MTDGELVRQTLNGRLAAYAELVERWSARILAVCRARVRTLDVAEDLAQESLVRGLQSLATLHDPEKFGAWLHGIAVRACLDWRKSKQSSQTPFSTLDTSAVRFDPASRAETADATVQRSEEIERLRASIAELPVALRETLLLYYCEQLTYQKLAELLGVSRGTVNLRLTQARALLRRKLVEIESKRGTSR